MAQLTNMSGKSLKDGKSVTLDDFLGGRKPRVQSMEEQIAVLKSMSSE